jgi:hypothetical protein
MRWKSSDDVESPLVIETEKQSVANPSATNMIVKTSIRHQVLKTFCLTAN